MSWASGHWTAVPRGICSCGGDPQKCQWSGQTSLECLLPAINKITLNVNTKDVTQYIDEKCGWSEGNWMRINEKLKPIKPHLKQNVNTILILRIGKEKSKLLDYKNMQTSADLPSCKREHINLSWAVDTKNNKCHTNCIHTAAIILISEQWNKLGHLKKEHGSRVTQMEGQ